MEADDEEYRSRIRRLEEKLCRGTRKTVIFLNTDSDAEGQRETGAPHPKRRDSRKQSGNEVVAEE